MKIKKKRKRFMIMVLLFVIMGIASFRIGIGLYYNNKIEDYRLQIQQQDAKHTQFLNQFNQ